MLLQHKVRRTGRTRRTVLEVVEYREQGPEVVVANGFRDSDWVLNLQANSDAVVSVGGRHFAASYRTLDEDEAAKVIERYELGTD